MKSRIETPSREGVSDLFDQISPTYDLLNHLLTGGLDVYWRKVLAKQIALERPSKILDIATGTADQLISILKTSKEIKTATGIDFSKGMLRRGADKLKRKGLHAELMVADALALPFEKDCFDALSISFGIRNVKDVATCLEEMKRVTRPKGKVFILEHSLPTYHIVKPFYFFYLRHILPRLGKWISKDPIAYTYLNETIETFPYGEEFINLMKQAGFNRVKMIPMTFGIVTLYIGEK